MSVRRSADAFVMDMSDQLYAARERIRDLEKVLGVHEPCPKIFGLSRTENVIFGILLKRSFSTKDTLFSGLYGGRYSDVDIPDPKVLDVFIYHVRRKVEPYGIKIETVWGQGYRISPEHKAKVAALLKAEQQ